MIASEFPDSHEVMQFVDQTEKVLMMPIEYFNFDRVSVLPRVEVQSHCSFCESSLPVSEDRVETLRSFAVLAKDHPAPLAPVFVERDQAPLDLG